MRPAYCCASAKANTRAKSLASASCCAACSTTSTSCPPNAARSARWSTCRQTVRRSDCLYVSLNKNHLPARAHTHRIALCCARLRDAREDLRHLLEAHRLSLLHPLRLRRVVVVQLDLREIAGGMSIRAARASLLSSASAPPRRPSDSRRWAIGTDWYVISNVRRTKARIAASKPGSPDKLASQGVAPPKCAELAALELRGEGDDGLYGARLVVEHALGHEVRAREEVGRRQLHERLCQDFAGDGAFSGEGWNWYSLSTARLASRSYLSVATCASSSGRMAGS